MQMEAAVFTQIPVSPGNAPDFVGGIVQPRIERQVTSFGGGASSGGNYSLVDTMGQAFAGQTSTGGSYSFESGFWAIPAEGRRTPFDFDGDGKTDLSIFRPAPGEWWYQRSSDGVVPAFQFGTSTDRIVPGDYTGDGKTDIAFWRPSTGFWFILRSEDSLFFSFPFGTNGDVPVPGDYDGDGKTDAAVFRPSTVTWFINKSSGGTIIQTFGAVGDKPVVADYDGDGKTDIAIFRPGPGEWWIQRSSDGIVPAFQFGTSTDKPVQGDYTGDGKADIAFWRPSTGFWFVLRSEDFLFFAFPWGTSTDIRGPGRLRRRRQDGRQHLSPHKPTGTSTARQPECTSSNSASQPISPCRRLTCRDHAAQVVSQVANAVQASVPERKMRSGYEAMRNSEPTRKTVLSLRLRHVS